MAQDLGLHHSESVRAVRSEWGGFHFKRDGAGHGDQVPGSEVIVQDFDEFYSDTELAYGDEPTPSLARMIEDAPAGGRVLDLGCGDGRNSLFLAGKGFRVTSVDRSAVGVASMLRAARRWSLDRRISGVVADARRLCFHGARFDLAAAVTLLDHLPEVEIDPLLDRLAGTLEPGGLLLVKVHTVADPGYGKEAGPGVSETTGAVRHYFARDELRQRLSRHCLIKRYKEGFELDTSHGEPHHHGFAIAIGLKG